MKGEKKWVSKRKWALLTKKETKTKRKKKKTKK